VKSKALIAGITLLLATAAHAAEDQLFECGNVTVKREYISDASIYNIQIGVSRREKRKLPVVVFDMSHANAAGGGLRLKVNGKSCKEIKQ
jgi:hypothetical protein